MDYITIAEYAKRAGVSKQTAYNRAKAPQYKGYFRRVNGVLMVDCSLLEVKQIFKFNSSLENGGDKGETEFSVKDNSSKFSSLENPLIDMLRKQLENQNQQIENLYAMIAEKDKTIRDLSASMAQITASIQALQHERNLIEAGGQVIAGQTEPQEQTQTGESSSKKGVFSFFRRRK